MSLHDELQRLADTAPRPGIDHDLWDRGRALRRRDRLVTSAVVLVLVLVVGGMGTLLVGPPRAVAPASDAVPGGAIPSRIYEPPNNDPLLEDDLDIGRASVAFVGANQSSLTPFATVIGAADGTYHFLSLPDLDQGREALALSPDGTRLAWRSKNSELHVADLTTGEVTDLRPQFATTDHRSWELGWRADSLHLAWAGSRQGGIFNVVTGEEERASARDYFTCCPVSPSGDLAAIRNVRRGGPARFATASSEKLLRRALPADLYPKGATVTPLGWADDHLVLATVFGPEGSYVEDYHLALFTSPDRPESEWTYRILVRGVPSSDELSIAVDLIPDLDGATNQQLTHDFGEPDWPGQGPDRLPLILGALMALLSGLALIRMLRYQR